MRSESESRIELDAGGVVTEKERHPDGASMCQGSVALGNTEVLEVLEEEEFR